MFDTFGRNIEYLRISVTDRCNLRCVYCMPEEGIQKFQHEDMLTYDEILRLSRIFADIGIKKIRLTGGEPLVRKNIAYLIEGLKQIQGIEKVCMTTNGILLSEQLETLLAAGLDGVNISIDSLQADKFKEITRKDQLEKVLNSIDQAAQIPGLEVKLNCVPMQYNEDELVDMTRYFLQKGLTLRFIELMPIGFGKDLQGISTDDLKKRLECAFGKLEQVRGQKLGGPSQNYKVKGYEGEVGFISAMSHEFCGNCNRVRLTADGCLKTCLQYRADLNLKKLLSENDDRLRNRIVSAIHHKPQNHRFHAYTQISDAESRIMAQIGG